MSHTHDHAHHGHTHDHGHEHGLGGHHHHGGSGRALVFSLLLTLSFAVVEAVGGGLELHINNAIMGTFLGANVGELDDLEITGDITWFGSTGSFIPEPSTGLLLGMGLLGLAARRRGAAR